MRYRVSLCPGCGRGRSSCKFQKQLSRKWLGALCAMVALALTVSTQAQTLNASAASLTPRTFQAVPGLQDVVVLGADSKLWYEDAPFGSLPPKRQPVDANVSTFQVINSQNILVLGTDGNLWLEPQPSGKIPRQQVDARVWTFQALDTQNIFVLGTDGNLWIEPAPFNRVPNPSRHQIDANVKAFQVLDAQDVLVLGNDGNLWLEQAPFGSLPPAHRTHIDGNIWTFQQGSLNNIFVLGMDGNLWLEQPPFGTGIPHRQQIDGNVRSFQAIPVLNWAWVLGTDGKLWLEQPPFGKLPPPNRQQVDANVRAFQGVDVQHVLVLGTDGNLWAEQAPFGTLPPPGRHIVDASVMQNARPGGTYQQSCNSFHMGGLDGTTLFATCQDDFGNWHPDELDAANACTGTIQNIHGALRCVITRDNTGIISLTTTSDSNWYVKSWAIDEPNVTQSTTVYPEIRYGPGDTIFVGAGGCVQTGGSGQTWKSYVHPLGDNATNYYFGEAQLPGVTDGLQPIAAVINKSWPVSTNIESNFPASELHLTLGYTDDHYGDNGYWGHDNGNPAQCVNIGPAWVTMQVLTPRTASPAPTGPVYSPGSKPFDLVWDVNKNVDRNGLPLNPRWFSQEKNVNHVDDFGELCGPAFTTSTTATLVPGFSAHNTVEDIGKLAATCTTQAPTLDLVGTNLFNVGDYCHDSGSPLTGHLNWGVVTYQGELYWQNWSGGFPQDEDYNIALSRPDESGLAASLPDEQPPNSHSFLLEFKSLESIDQYFGSAWWLGFRKLAESDTYDWEQASTYINGSAIATGELGIDGAHKTGYSELHPLYALAVHLFPDQYGANYIDEHWAFFIRNQGTEGSCSQNTHSWASVSGGNDYYIQLPWPDGASGVGIQGSSVWLWQDGDTLGPVKTDHHQWTYLQFNLPMGMGSGADGDVTLRYTLANAPNIKAQLRKPQLFQTPPRPENEVNWGQILPILSDSAVKSHVQKMLGTRLNLIPASRGHAATMAPQVGAYQAISSLGSRGILTRSRTAIDPVKAGQIVNADAALGFPPTTFQQLPGSSNIFVLGMDQNLWFEQPPFGKVPSARQQVDGNVQTFQALDDQTVLVLGSNGNLWLEHAPFGKVPPARVQVDGNVLAFQALSTEEIFVLGSDRNLWLEQSPFGRVPPTRVQVDGNVRAFQALDSNTVLVVGTDDNLWLEHAPFGSVPPRRQHVDSNVWAFRRPQPGRGILVQAADGKLWLERPPFGNAAGPRLQVDGNVQAFQALDMPGPVWVLGTDGNLWLERRPFGTVPPQRQQIDANVSSFQPLDVNHVLVRGTDGNLWLEQGPFGTVPPQRVQIDGNVR